MTFTKRYNTCPETAISGAIMQSYPGTVIKFKNDAENDEQCDLGTLFARIPNNKDISIHDPKLGNQSNLVKEAAQLAAKKAQAEKDPEHDSEGFTELFEKYKQEILKSSAINTENIIKEYLQKLDISQVYVLRTGIVDFGGHFHILFFKDGHWILDSGASANSFGLAKGILYEPKTDELGPMADSLMDLAAEWGNTHGKTMISIYAMNRERMMIAANYIALFRNLNTNATKEINPEELINSTISQTDYLNKFDSEYWLETNTTLPKASENTHIECALSQCQRDLKGAVSQLKELRYFDDIKNAKQLLIDMIKLNNFMVVEEILNNNLIDLKTIKEAQDLYHASKPKENISENQAFRILQNKLLDTFPSESIVSMKDAFEALNESAILKIFEKTNSINNEQFELDILKTPLSLKDGIFLPEKIRESKLGEEYYVDKLLSINASNKLTIWKIACNYLCCIYRYCIPKYCQEDSLSQPCASAMYSAKRSIEYSLDKDGKQIIWVSKEVQIAMDEIYAKKIAEELEQELNQAEKNQIADDAIFAKALQEQADLDKDNGNLNTQTPALGHMHSKSKSFLRFFPENIFGNKTFYQRNFANELSPPIISS